MKMKQEHYDHLRNALTGRLNAQSTMLQRWNALYATVQSSWICKTLYPYLNDNHIDTALRAICKEQG